MRIVGIAVAKDEAGVIEPFVRIHRKSLDGLIVLDDGSTDGTRAILERLARADPRVVVIDGAASDRAVSLATEQLRRLEGSAIPSATASAPKRWPGRAREGRPVVTVVVPTRDAAATLQTCLDAAAAELAPGDTLIVVDAGSRDDTQQIAERFARGWAGAAEVIQAGPDGGLSGAIAAGLVAATGEVSALVPAAVGVPRGFLDEVTSLLESRRGAGAVALEAPGRGLCLVGRNTLLHRLALNDRDALVDESGLRLSKALGALSRELVYVPAADAGLAVSTPSAARPAPATVVFGPGFFEQESTWRWMSKSATLTVARPASRTTLSFDLTCGKADRYGTFPFEVTVSAGEASMHVVTFERSEQTHHVELSVDPSPSDAVVTFDSQQSFVPAASGGGDGRELSVRLQDLRLGGHPIPPTRAPQTAPPRPPVTQAGTGARAFAFAGVAREEGYRQALESFAANPHVLVELNSRCNFHCRYCRSSSSGRQKSFMPRKLFDRLLAQLPDVTKSDLRLHVDGEPTLHPEFLEMALDANRAGHRIALATNASNLKTDFLSISMALVVNVSTSPEELATRSRMRFERYLEGVKRYVTEWTQRPTSQQLVLKIYTSAEERCQPHLVERKKAFAHAFVEGVGLADRGRWADGTGGLTHEFTCAKSPQESLSLTVQPLAEGGLYPNLSGCAMPGAAIPAGRGFCDAAWKTLAVLSDGTVSYCCVDITGETGFTRPDDVWRHGLKDLWLHHPAIQKDRTDFLAGRVTRPICQQCLASAHHRELYLFPTHFPYPPTQPAQPAASPGGTP